MSDGDLAISLRGVGKQFTKYEDSPTLINGLLRRGTGNRRSKFWAVRDINLDVPRGQNVGLIGRNGSGKSTLLQMLCGVTAPSVGEVVVRGRIAPLISVGVGFHPELTGRENIFLNAAILGLSRAQTAEKLEAIIDFSGVEAFVDTPLKFYSSGMSVRLGFAVAAHSEPEVLLVDEVLAVGDLSFQVKSFDFIEQLRLNGTTVFVVSHNLAAIQRLCARSMVLDGGVCEFDGPTEGAISAYHGILSKLPSDAPKDPMVLAHEREVIHVRGMSMRDDTGAESAYLRAGQGLALRIAILAKAAVSSPFAVILVYSSDGLCIYNYNNMLETFPALEAGDEAEWLVELNTNLPTGSYSVAVQVARTKSDASSPLEERLSEITVLATPPSMTFYVEGRAMVKGVNDLEGRFSVVSQRQPAEVRQEDW